MCQTTSKSPYHMQDGNESVSLRTADIPLSPTISTVKNTACVFTLYLDRQNINAMENLPPKWTQIKTMRRTFFFIAAQPAILNIYNTSKKGD